MQAWNRPDPLHVYPVVIPINTFNGFAMSRKLFSSSVLTLMAIAVAGCASFTAPPPAVVADGVLVASNAMTLYVFDKDAPGSGKSACNGPCAKNWPPLAAAGDLPSSSDWAVIAREDGSKQWAYKGKPVYFWAKDQKPGDRTGDGFNGVWHLAKP